MIIHTRTIGQKAREALSAAGATIRTSDGHYIVEVEGEQVSSRQMAGWKPMGHSTAYRLATGHIITHQKGRDGAESFDDLNLYS